MVNPCDAKEKADQVLRLLKSTVESLGCDLVLLRGTCLGFVRDGDFIENDNDIDVGIISGSLECLGEEKEIVSERLLEAGFKCPNPVLLAGQEHWWAHNSDIMFCIRWIFEFPNAPGFSHLCFLKSFDEVTYNEETYNVPHPVEVYFGYFYRPELYGGVGWRTPHLRGWRKALKSP